MLARNPSRDVIWKVFDICILDVMLPHIDGFAVARHIKKTEPELSWKEMEAMPFDVANRLLDIIGKSASFLRQPPKK